MRVCGVIFVAFLEKVTYVRGLVSMGAMDDPPLHFMCEFKLKLHYFSLLSFNHKKKSRSPALKPLWLSLGGSDAETLFSGLFRKFFCHDSRDYFAGLSAAKETHLDGKVIPAYLLHIKDLAIGLG